MTLHRSAPTLADRLALLFILGAVVAGCGRETEEPSPPLEPRVWLADLEAGLELHYTFEDRSGSTITDMSGNSRDGTLQGGSFTPSPWGEAFVLDGIDDSITLAGPRDPALFGGTNGEMTVHARVRVGDVGKLNTLCFGCGPWNATYVGTDIHGPRVLSAIYNQATTGKLWPLSTSALVNDAWVDVTMIVEGGVSVRYYLDCELDTLFAHTDVGLHDYGYSSIGEGASSSTWLQGEIDDLRIWNRALSDDELLLACTRPSDELCGGAPEGPGLVTPPAPPTSYTLPDVALPHVTDVTDAAGLENAVNSGLYTDIILDDGAYDHADLAGGWLQIRGHRLWARNVGGAVLNFGISAGGNNGGAYDFSGPELHGLVFDIDDTAHAPDSGGPGGATDGISAFLTWGDATDAVVEDSTFDGNSVIDIAIFAAQLEGLSIARVEIDDFDRFGISAQDGNSSSLAQPMSMTDISIRRIGDPDCWGVEEAVCGFYPGTQENAIHLGDTAVLNRIFIRDARASGVALGGETDGTDLSNLDIDRIGVGHSIMGVGVYFERITRNTDLESFCVGPHTRIGVNSEWDHNVAPRGISNVVRDGLIESSFVGVHADQGTVDFEVHDVTFRNYSRAGIIMHNNLAAEIDWPSYDDGGTQHNNTFGQAQINGQICDFTRDHWNDSTPSCE